MKTKSFKPQLIEWGACREGITWWGERTLEKGIADLYRGDWLLWLHFGVRPDDLQSRTLAKGHCANTVRHLMKDKRSLDAVDAAIAFGNGEITKEALNKAAYAATHSAAAYAAHSAAAYSAYAAAATYSTYAAAAAATYSTYAATHSAYAYSAHSAAAYAAGDAARTKNQRLTADICCKYLKWE